MLKSLVIAFLLSLLCTTFAKSQCAVNQKEFIIQIQPDDYPQETTWNLQENGVTIASGNSISDTVCVGQNSCIVFEIFDSAGDGICCGYGNGSYALFSDALLVHTGGNFGYSESYNESCVPGTICENPIPLQEGIFQAPNYNTFYAFTPDTTGNYYLTTCNQSPCDTKLWIYSSCGPHVQNSDGSGALYYDDDGANCGYAAGITAYLYAGTTYWLKIGLYDNLSCPGPIGFELTFLGEIVGCMDPTACNYNPLATISDGICFGPETIDCSGICNGNTVVGDLNSNQQVELNDVTLYLQGILDQSITNSACKDLSNDGILTVWDAALAANCALNSSNCTFPNDSTNLDETVEIGFLSINPTEHYFDISIKNPVTTISGYELNISGVTLTDVQQLIPSTEFPANPLFLIGGTKIIGLSYSDSMFGIHAQNTPLLRVYYENQISGSICIESVVHCLNQNFRPTKVNLIDGCVFLADLDEPEMVTFELSPNPCNQMVHIQFMNPTNDCELIVSDALGRIINRKKSYDWSESVDISTENLSNGIYQISLIQEQTIQTKRLFISHE